MKSVILFPEHMAGDAARYLEERGYEVKYGRGIQKEELIEDLQGCAGVIVRVAKIDEEVFSACPELKVVAKHGVGVDNIDLEAARRHGCRVTSTPQANANSVAEHAMALVISCAKDLNHLVSGYPKQGYAVKNGAPIWELKGKTLGLLGFGKIGSSVARMAALGFGMKVEVYDPYVPRDLNQEGVTLLDSREQLFRNADFLSIHMPALPTTVKSVGNQEFEWMKPTAYLINTARGTIVDEEALIRALEEGKIGGAGLDVSDPEPASPDSKLFAMSNVIMTPHSAASSREAMVNMAVGAAQGVDEVLAGKEITWPVV